MTEQATTEIVVDPKANMLSVSQVRRQLTQVQDLMREVMQDGKHYGKVPGTQKPTLLKPGAELLTMMFRLDPQYSTKETLDPDDHLTVVSTCTLWHIGSGVRIASGMGSCSSKESKYAYRAAKRVCPKCGKEAIFKSKEEYGGGWYCWKKPDVGGCGAEFKPGTPEAETISKQNVGKVPNDDLADTHNTVLKMSNKRSLVAAVLNATAASEIFTQDVEDMDDNKQAGNPKAAPRPAPAAAATSKTAAAAPKPLDTKEGHFTVIRLDEYTPAGQPATAKAWQVTMSDQEGTLVVKTNLEPFAKTAQEACASKAQVTARYDIYEKGNVLRSISVLATDPAAGMGVEP